MFRLNLWTPFMHPPPTAPPNLGDTPAHVPNPLTSPALMVLATRDGVPHPFPAPGVDKDLPAGATPYSSAYPLFRQGEHFPPPLYSHMHAPFMRPGHSLGLINPGGGGAFRPVGSADDRDSYHSAFIPAKRARMEDLQFTYGRGGSPDSDKHSPDAAQDYSISQSSPEKEEREMALRSPELDTASETRSELESPHRTTPDQGQRKRLADGQPPTCPVCNVTLRPGEIEAHLSMELERLYTFTREKPGVGNCSSQTDGQTSFKERESGLMTSTDITSKSRYETYLRVRNNRNARINAKRGYKTTKKSKDDAIYAVSTTERLVDVHDETPGEPVMDSTLKTRVDEDETVDIEGDDKQYADKWAEEARKRVGFLNHESPTELIDDSLETRSDVSRCEIEAHDVSNERDFTHATFPDSQHSIEELRKKGQTLKCQVCMETYRKPLASVQCWHVHCEKCWLRSLGVKKACPECNVITSPSDLRKIYV